MKAPLLQVMQRLASAGYYVIAPGRRGFGRTTGQGGSYDGDLRFLQGPRNYYQRYYTTHEADNPMRNCPRATTLSSALITTSVPDWKQIKPFPLKARAGEEMARMPTY